MNHDHLDRRRAVRTRGLPLLSVALILACEPGGPDSNGGFTVTDSSGVRIVESVAPQWADGEGWTIAAEPEVVIGEVGGDERYLLDNVAGVRRLSDGRIAVLDGGSSSVRVYDAQGRHLFDVGGPGDGPEEFSGAQYLDVVGDTIVVYERSPLSLTWFDSGGAFLGAALLSRADGRALSPIAFGLEGARQVLVMAAPSRTPEMPTQKLQELAALRTIWRFGIEGAVPDSLAEMKRGRREVLFDPTTYVTASDDWIYVAPSEQYSIEVLDRQGALRRIIRRTVEPRGVTPGDVERYAEQAVAAAFLPPERVEGVARSAREGPIADVMPAYRLVTVDTQENLWVEDWDDVGVDQGAFSVFRSDGVWLGRVVLPPGLPWIREFNPRLEIGEDYVLGMWVAELGVQQVRLYRIEKR